MVAPARLRALVAADPARAGDDVLTHTSGLPEAVGAGEDAADPHARVADGPVLVLVDGRAVTLVTREALEHGHTTAG